MQPQSGGRPPHRSGDYWHVTGLPAGKHSVRIELRAAADSRSTGKRIQIERAIVYGPAAK